MRFFHNVSEGLPTVENQKSPHTKQLILRTQSFGPFLGFYDGKHFRTSYAEILENVTHWEVIESEIQE